MGGDTIQLENAVSTISQEYLLEFTSEYGIPEDLHPELPGPDDTIVDFSEGKVGVYTRVMDMEDPVATATYSETPSIMENSPLDFSSEDPPPMITDKGKTEDQAPVVVSQEVSSAENIATMKVVPEVNLEKEIATMRPPINKKRR
ncbi:hypothetical protein Tco_0858698, partial [Tanacetum coccineum]